MKRITPLALAGLLPILMAGCTLAPKYVRPEAPVPADWSAHAVNADDLAATAADTAAAAPKAVLLSLAEFLPDERLLELIDLALANNRDLQIAALNMERARELYHVRRNELLPSVGAAAYGSRQHDPAEVSSSGAAVTYEYYNVDVGIISWELDLFGRVRSLKNAGLEQYLSTAEARRAVHLSLQSRVAAAWLALASDQDFRALADSTLVSQEADYTMMARRSAVGLGSEIDLTRAKSRVEAARDAAARARLSVAQDRNLLDFLAGTPVPEHLLPQGWDSIQVPREISAGLSSEVLLSRPDVMAAEHQLRAAYANMGAARAAFFPRISLTSLLGTASNALSGLFTAGSKSWTFAGAATMPIFDARTIAASKATTADRDLVLAQYEKSIQTAFRETCDALAVQTTIDERLAAQQAWATAAAETYRLALRRYDTGLDSYLSVLDAQRSLFAVQQGVIATRLSKYANLVNLYAILGGGGA
ncbi:MAG TPA: efflux transporter outer membrane subunit [Phycisphaerae bacterium]|nr:efflux transporter outer membrane subunit [Phycisphaerae bacterium]